MSKFIRSVKGRLFIASLLPLCAFAVSGFFTYKGLHELIKIIQYDHQVMMPSIESLGEIRMARNMYGYHAYAAIYYVDNPERRVARLKLARTAIEKFEAAQKIYEGLPHVQEARNIYGGIVSVKSEYLGLLRTILDAVEKGNKEGVAEASEILNGRALELGLSIGKVTEDSAQFYKDQAAAEKEKAAALIKAILFRTIVMLVSFGILVSGTLAWLAHSLSTAISSVIRRLEDSVTGVGNAILQLNQTGTELSQSTVSSASSLEETVASLEEMTSMVQNNSESAKQAADLSVATKKVAEDGSEEILSLIESMKTISESSRKIEEIINVIDDIAFQTNLLALNASVEAARAGEHGKGFAVVADAVRTLAQRSASAAKDIGVLIRESVERVNKGQEIADRSGTALGEIVKSVSKVVEINNEISAASSEQSLGIQQISRAMNMIDESTQRNASSAEGIANTSGEIAGLAQTSQDLVQELNVVLNGG